MIEEHNFLTDKEQETIKDEIIESSYFPWFWTPVSSSDDYPFFCHVLKSRGQEGVNSDWFNFFYPIVQRFIEKHKLFKGKYEAIRGAVNHTLSLDESCDPHVDFEEDHLVFIMYLTDSSGNTDIYTEKWEEGKLPEYLNRDGKKNLEIQESISPEKGKMICFNGLNYHSVKFQKPKERRLICIFAIKGEQNVVL
jgi:hypothetical protein